MLKAGTFSKQLRLSEDRFLLRRMHHLDRIIDPGIVDG